jgi:hypothetical protein
MGSLGLIGKVFEVRTQVDCDLTTVNRVDWQLGLIKNLGRHSYRPHGRDPTSSSKCSNPAPTSWPPRTVRNWQMLGTSNSYVACTLRKDFQVSFCYLHTQHPGWLYKCKFHRINKVKGWLGFPLDTKSLSGATAPPPKWPVFSKIHRKCAKCASTQTLGELTWDASSQRVKKHESGIAHASSRIRPFPLAALPTSYSCERNLPSQGSPKKMGKAEQHNCRNK